MLNNIQKKTRIVYKDGSWLDVDSRAAWEYWNDPDYLTSFDL